jgi:hypothetical protein
MAVVGVLHDVRELIAAMRFEAAAMAFSVPYFFLIASRSSSLRSAKRD